MQPNLQMTAAISELRVATPQGQATLRPQSFQSPTEDVHGKRILAVDVDEVLCRCAEAFMLWQTGNRVSDVNECFQICYAHSNAAVREQFFNSEAAVNAQAVPGAFEAIQALKAMNFEVHAITARPFSAQSVTYQFLERCFPRMIAALHLATPPSSPSKGSIAKSLGAVGLVDDQLPHVLEASQKLQAVLFDFEGCYSWTKTPEPLPKGVVRKTSWPEVVEWARLQIVSSSAGSMYPCGSPHATTYAVQAAAEMPLKPLGLPAAGAVAARLKCLKALGLEKDFQHVVNLVFKKTEPLTIGRSHQTDDFEKLVPDEALRSCVSRSHFSISWDGERFFLKRLSANAMFLDDIQIQQQKEVLLNDGARIGLSSEANGRSSFLVFEFQLDARPSVELLGEPVMQERQNESSWMVSLDNVPFYLLCTMSASREVVQLPAEQRAVPLPRSLTLGRQHQPGFFEDILGPQSMNLTFISRSHLELSEVEPGNFMVLNHSQNPVVIKGLNLSKEQQSFLCPGDSIDFIAGSDLKCFLRLTLEQGNSAAVVAKPVQGTAGETGRFWLELDGSAVKPEIPMEQRRIDPQAGQITVGRAFQHDLHQKALNEDALAWVSREHFRIEQLEGSTTKIGSTASASFKLLATSSNPLWRQRGDELYPMEKHDETSLEHRDRIWLYTGAADGQPAGEGHRGTIVWTFCRA